MTTGTGGAAAPSPGHTQEPLDRVSVRFAGDSGDGMQLTGNQFTTTTALVGNDLATLPDYPAEIRAPAGSLAGVSGFQIQFGSLPIYTPGDRPDVLVAMNPAALMANLPSLEPGAMILVNEDGFDKKALTKAGLASNPLDEGDDTLDAYRVYKVPITTLTRNALSDFLLTTRQKDRSKNFCALGLVYWLFERPLDHTLGWVEKKFAKRPQIVDANKAALRAGYNFGETAEMFPATYQVRKAPIAPGTYRQITGNAATALGLVAAAQLADMDLFLGSYPITPASDILHELSKHKRFGVKTFQAEDEIAAVTATLGAAYGGALAVTSTSGPGVALKSEGIGLGVMVELPMVICNVQRGGPSTGLPTKTEQSDLLQALYGRNGDAPVPVIAASTPADCFDCAMEAARLAVKHMTPVFLLTDGYLANGAEPWKLPRVADLPKIEVKYRRDPEGFQPYDRDPETLARPWVRPGTPGLEHRIGGLESEAGSGNVSYDPRNHQEMTRVRAEKVARIARDIPPAPLFGEEEGDLLLVGWGGTFGALHAATDELRREGLRVSHLHLRHINPMPENVERVLRGFRRVVAAELNMGQLRQLLRARFLVDVGGLNKVQGQPFQVSEVIARVRRELDELTGSHAGTQEGTR